MAPVEGEDDLGVGVGLEHIALRYAVLAQGLEVVDSPLNTMAFPVSGSSMG